MPDEEDLLDRILELRGALHGLTADNAELRRELARIRRENGSLRDALDRSQAAAQDAERRLLARGGVRSRERAGRLATG